MKFDQSLSPRMVLLALVVAVGSLPATVSAQTAPELHLRALAARCANCHGTDSAAVAGSGGVSAARMELVATCAMAWASNVLAESLS